MRAREADGIDVVSTSFGGALLSVNTYQMYQLYAGRGAPAEAHCSELCSPPRSNHPKKNRGIVPGTKLDSFLPRTLFSCHRLPLILCSSARKRNSATGTNERWCLRFPVEIL